MKLVSTIYWSHFLQIFWLPDKMWIFRGLFISKFNFRHIFHLILSHPRSAFKSEWRYKNISKLCGVLPTDFYISVSGVTLNFIDLICNLYLVGFVTIWERFQKNARTLIENITNEAEHILWTSTLTSPDFIDLLPNDYTIQIWADETVSRVDKSFSFFRFQGSLM